MFCNRVTIFAALVVGAASRLTAQPEPPAPPAPAIPVTPAPLAPIPPLPPEPPISIDLGPDLERVSVQAMNAANRALEAANRNLVKLNLDMPFFQRGFYGSGNDDRLYENGQRALDRSQWNNALNDFTQVASHAGPRADGALYWKAYALNKLGRRDEAIAAIADLRKNYTKSRWLDDAGALEIEAKQATGQSVSPDAQPDEELKLLALNALVRSDPDRALPILENLLKGSQPPRLKERALFVLGQNDAPQAQQLLAQMARGSGNPDLQLKAIQYLGLSRQQTNGQTLADVYSASSDAEIKDAVINALALQERNTRFLVDLARKERDPEVKRTIVHRLSSMKSKEALDYMMELLK